MQMATEREAPTCFDFPQNVGLRGAELCVLRIVGHYDNFITKVLQDLIQITTVDGWVADGAEAGVVIPERQCVWRKAGLLPRGEGSPTVSSVCG